jgi:PPOX class probable F420-dependent enzyme
VRHGIVEGEPGIFPGPFGLVFGRLSRWLRHRGAGRHQEVFATMATMSESEIRAFLLEGTRTAKLATIRKDGRPHVAPVWFLVDDDGAVVFTTGAGSVKGRSLRRDGRVALTVDDEHPPYSFVMIEGTASVSEDLSALKQWATRIGGRYMGADRAEEYGARNGVAGELLVRVRPDRVVAQRNIAA